VWITGLSYLSLLSLLGWDALSPWINKGSIEEGEREQVLLLGLELLANLIHFLFLLADTCLAHHA
jgi:hypothetical protein